MKKQCPKCKEIDSTDSSSCRFCSTAYDCRKPSSRFHLKPQYILFLGVGIIALIHSLFPAPAGVMDNAPHVYGFGRGGRTDLLASVNYSNWLNTQPGGAFIVILIFILSVGVLAWAVFSWLTKDNTKSSL
jgi:hypothetical protein